LIAAPIYRHQYFITALSMLLILFIGFKVLLPLFKQAKIVIKEVTLTAESDDDKSEKKDNADVFDKYKENISIANHTLNDLFWYTQVIHLLFYSFDYKSAHFLKITSPPPDFCLQYKA